MKTCLYRHFDYNDTLLYVGISINPISRQYQHSNNSDWWGTNLSRTEYEWYDTNEGALYAEMAAIRKEKPIYNKRHNNKDENTCDGIDVVEYLEIRKVMQILKIIDGLLSEDSHNNYFMGVLDIERKILDYFVDFLGISSEELMDDGGCGPLDYLNIKVCAADKRKVDRIVLNKCLSIVNDEITKEKNTINLSEKPNRMMAFKEIRRSLLLIKVTR